MAEAEALLAALHEFWGRVQAEGLIGAPQGRIIEVVESIEV